MLSGVTHTHFTEGFGNNMFQYVFGRLVAEKSWTDLRVILPSENYFGRKAFERLGVNLNPRRPIKRFKTFDINDSNAKDVGSMDYLTPHRNYSVRGHFEDYTLFEDHLDEIRSWFPAPKEKNDEDLILHLRLGDRLVYKNQYGTGMFSPAEDYKKVFKNFNFKRLHISTDLDSWEKKTPEDISKMKFHINVPEHQKVDPKVSADYVNSLIEGFREFNPIIHNSGDLDLIEDFNLIRGFKNILGQHSTFFWWAAVLSEAEKVGVYGPWRPAKGKSNKNLGQTNYKGWFSWG